MATLRECHQGLLDEAGVVQRMRLLLAGHPDLLDGFGRFLSRVGALGSGGSRCWGRRTSACCCVACAAVWQLVGCKHGSGCGCWPV